MGTALWHEPKPYSIPEADRPRAIYDVCAKPLLQSGFRFLYRAGEEFGAERSGFYSERCAPDSRVRETFDNRIQADNIAKRPAYLF